MHDTAPTVRQRLLLAADKLEAAGHCPFTAEALTVQAWKDSPERFGLKGFKAEYPCSNSTYTYFMGERGMVKTGHLEKVGKKLYRLTDPGKLEVGRLKRGDCIGQATGRVQPGRDCEARLSRAFAAKAFVRVRSGQRDTVNWTDALDLWGANHDDRADIIDAHRAVLCRYVREAQASTVAGVCRFRSGREVRAAELVELCKVNEWLGTRFRRELERLAKAA